MRKENNNPVVQYHQYSMSCKLRELIRNVRACKTMAEERGVIAKECAMIRTAFKENANEFRHRNVAKVRLFHQRLQDKVAADRQVQIAHAAHQSLDNQLADSSKFDFGQLAQPARPGTRNATPAGRPYTPARPLADFRPVLRPPDEASADPVLRTGGLQYDVERERLASAGRAASGVDESPPPRNTRARPDRGREGAPAQKSRARAGDTCSGARGSRGVEQRRPRVPDHLRAVCRSGHARGRRRRVRARGHRKLAAAGQLDVACNRAAPQGEADSPHSERGRSAASGGGGSTRALSAAQAGSSSSSSSSGRPPLS